MVLAIIVTDENHLGEHPNHLALKLNRHYKSPRNFNLVSVERCNPRNRRNSDDSENRKFLSKPLYFGTILKFAEYDEGNLLSVVYPYQYQIMTDDVYQTRIHEGQTQILLNGIMSRNRQVFWMNAFPTLKIPYSMRMKSTPDVAVNAWITLQILPDLLLNYEFSEFASLALEFQHEVRKTPWYDEEENKNIRHIDVANYELSNQSAQNIESPFAKPPNLELSGIDGVVLSSTSIIALKHPNIAFKKVVEDGNPLPPVGSYVKFNAEWMDFVGYYAIKSAKHDKNSPLKPLGVTENGRLRVTIKKCQNLPGLLVNEYLGIYIDDPENILEVWQFSKFANSSLSVAICDGSPDRNGRARYFVVEITDKKEAKLEDTLMSGDMKLENVTGLVLEKKRLFIPQYPSLQIILSRLEANFYPVGSVVTVTVKLENSEWTVSKITNDATSLRFETKLAEKTPERKIVLYKIPSVSGVREIPRCLQHPIFGLIATPPNFKELKNPLMYNFNDVWVSLNDSHPGDIMLPPYRFQYMTSGGLDDKESASCSGDDFSDVESVASSKTSTTSRYRRKVHFDENENQIRLIESSRSECFANSLNIPETSEIFLLGDNDSDWAVFVERNFEAIIASDTWKTKPEETTENAIDAHIEHCETCRDRDFGEKCFFPDILAKLVLKNPTIVNLLARRDMFSFIVSRRFKT